MATEITFTDLTSEQKLETADIYQKIQAIDGALKVNNDALISASAVFNKKKYALEEKKKALITQLQTLRVATIKEA